MSKYNPVVSLEERLEKLNKIEYTLSVKDGDFRRDMEYIAGYIEKPGLTKYYEPKAKRCLQLIFEYIK